MNLNNHLFLISQNIQAGLKGPKIKYKLHYGWCTRGDILRPPHCTTPAEVKANKNKKMSSYKSNDNIHKKADGSYYVVSVNKTLLVTL